MADAWRHDAKHPTDYNAVRVSSAREYILRLNTGADLWLAVQRFAKDHDIRFGKIHAAFMGGLAPARFLVWAPDARDPGNWHHEESMRIDNLGMILSLSGIIHVREVNGIAEPFPAIHFVVGGAWNVPTIGGHLLEGSIVRGAFEVFITELTGIEVLYGPKTESSFPENWYRPVDPSVPQDGEPQGGAL